MNGLRRSSLVACVLCASLAAPTSEAAPTSSSVLDDALTKAGASSAHRTAAQADFAKLPAGAQTAILGTLSPGYAQMVGRVTASPLGGLRADRLVPRVVAPTIDGMDPVKGGGGEWVLLSGDGFSELSTVTFDGATIPVSYFEGLLAFQTPSGEVAGKDYDVVVHAKAFASAAKKWKVVAPPGYRGVYGWKFRNFSAPAVSWQVYRDYFGPRAVEHNSGAHRPSAQLYYDALYKLVSVSGDCLGMSLRSIRTRRQIWQGIYASWWQANTKASVWDYDFLDPQIADSIREDHGSQLSLQHIRTIADRFTNGTPIDAYNFTRDALASGDLDRTPVLAIYALDANGVVTGGHAVIPWKIEVAGAVKTLRLYDNNKPYAENEQSDGNSAAVIDTSANTFTYLGYTKVYAASYNELVYDKPKLPSDATINNALGSVSDDTTVVISETRGALRQVKDATGRTFFSGGKPNTNPATRIPGAMRYVPVTGSAADLSFQDVCVFNQSRGASLSFDVDHTAPVRVHVISKGRLLSMTLKTGTFQVDKLMEEEGIYMIDPSHMGLVDVQMLAVQPDGSERQFKISATQLGSGNLGLRLAAADAGIDVQSGLSSPVSLSVTTKGYADSGTQQRTDVVSVIAQNQHTLAHADFQNLTLAPRVTVTKLTSPPPRLVP